MKILILIALTSMSFINALDINCDYTNSVYGCTLSSFDGDECSNIETNFNHLNGLTDNDVTSVIISSETLKFFPLGIHEKFGNIEELIIDSSSITKITLDDLKSFGENLKILQIESSSINELPADLFSETKNIQSLSVKSDNMNIHEDTFKPIKNSLKSLKVDLACFSGTETSEEEIQKIIENLKTKCNDPSFVSTVDSRTCDEDTLATIIINTPSTEPPTNQPSKPTTTTEPEKSKTEPEKPTTEPQTKNETTTTTTTEPEKPKTEPEKPKTEPEKPTTEPQTKNEMTTTTTTEPEKSKTEPEKSISEPEKSITEPEKSTTEPEKSNEPTTTTTTKAPDSIVPKTLNLKSKNGCNCTCPEAENGNMKLSLSNCICTCSDSESQNPLNSDLYKVIQPTESSQAIRNKNKFPEDDAATILPSDTELIVTAATQKPIIITETTTSPPTSTLPSKENKNLKPKNSAETLSPSSAQPSLQSSSQQEVNLNKLEENKSKANSILTVCVVIITIGVVLHFALKFYEKRRNSGQSYDIEMREQSRERSSRTYVSK